MPIREVHRTTWKSVDFEASFVEIDFHNGRARLDRVGQVAQSLQQVGQYIIRHDGDELEDQQRLMQRSDTRHRIWFESMNFNI